MSDSYKEAILRIIRAKAEPLETKEVQELATQTGVNGMTRSKLLHRLNDLRGEGEIRGKFVGPGKGVWIWWSDTQTGKPESDSLHDGSTRRSKGIPKTQ